MEQLSRKMICRISCRAVHTPTSPFQQNAVKYGPGRGGGFRTGNRTVTQCWVLVSFFPPARRGKCCPFFYFSVFCVWSGVFCRFFTVLLFLGSLFENIFGSELLFLDVGVGRVFFGPVLPMLLLYYSFFRSRNCLDKILLMSGLVFLGFFSPLLVFSPMSSLFLFFFLFFSERQIR